MGHCRVCGRFKQLRNRRCPACNKHWREYGYERTADLIRNAVVREEKAAMSDSMKFEDESAMTASSYVGRSDPPPNCTCSSDCSRLGSALHGGLSPYCAQLEAHRARRQSESAAAA